MKESFLQVKGVTKNYGRGSDQVSVLEKLDLTVEEGEFLALMGPSGSGKTTLLNLLGGIDRPSSGEIRVNNQAINELSDFELTKWRARTIGFIFQFYNLMPNLTAQKNVELPLLLTSLSASQRAQNAKTALEVVGLKERVHHKPSALSGGQEQRVAIARAMVSDPLLMLCDEPTGDLDRKTADEILNLLQILNKEHGKTIVMVTHDPKAADFAKRVLYMDKGALINSEMVA